MVCQGFKRKEVWDGLNFYARIAVSNFLLTLEWNGNYLGYITDVNKHFLYISWFL